MKKVFTFFLIFALAFEEVSALSLLDSQADRRSLTRKQRKILFDHQTKSRSTLHPVRAEKKRRRILRHKRWAFRLERKRIRAALRQDKKRIRITRRQNSRRIFANKKLRRRERRLAQRALRRRERLEIRRARLAAKRKLIALRKGRRPAAKVLTKYPIPTISQSTERKPSVRQVQTHPQQAAPQQREPLPREQAAQSPSRHDDPAILEQKRLARVRQEEVNQRQAQEAARLEEAARAQAARAEQAHAEQQERQRQEQQAEEQRQEEEARTQAAREEEARLARVLEEEDARTHQEQEQQRRIAQEQEETLRLEQERQEQEEEVRLREQKNLKEMPQKRSKSGYLLGPIPEFHEKEETQTTSTPQRPELKRREGHEYIQEPPVLSPLLNSNLSDSDADSDVDSDVDEGSSSMSSYSDFGTNASFSSSSVFSTTSSIRSLRRRVSSFDLLERLDELSGSESDDEPLQGFNRWMQEAGIDFSNGLKDTQPQTEDLQESEKLEKGNGSFFGLEEKENEKQVILKPLEKTKEIIKNFLNSPDVDIKGKITTAFQKKNFKQVHSREVSDFEIKRLLKKKTVTFDGFDYSRIFLDSNGQETKSKNLRNVFKKEAPNKSNLYTFSLPSGEEAFRFFTLKNSSARFVVFLDPQESKKMWDLGDSEVLERAVVKMLQPLERGDTALLLKAFEQMDNKRNNADNTIKQREAKQIIARYNLALGDFCLKRNRHKKRWERPRLRESLYKESPY